LHGLNRLYGFLWRDEEMTYDWVLRVPSEASSFAPT